MLTIEVKLQAPPMCLGSEMKLPPGLGKEAGVQRESRSERAGYEECPLTPALTAALQILRTLGQAGSSYHTVKSLGGRHLSWWLGSSAPMSLISSKREPSLCRSVCYSSLFVEDQTDAQQVSGILSLSVQLSSEFAEQAEAGQVQHLQDEEALQNHWPALVKGFMQLSSP